jgi:hypothetical protein
MAFARRRSLTVTADGGSNQTPWISAKSGAIVIISGTFTATITLQRRNSDGTIVDVTNNSAAVTTFTAAGTYTLNPNFVQGDYRLNCKSGAFTSGPLTMSIEAR